VRYIRPCISKHRMKKIYTMLPPVIALNIVTLVCYETRLHRQTLRERVLDDLIGIQRSARLRSAYIPPIPSTRDFDAQV
jgi:hypothetical protein